MHTYSKYPPQDVAAGSPGGTIAAARAKKMGQTGNITCATELLMDYYPELYPMSGSTKNDQVAQRVKYLK